MLVWKILEVHSTLYRVFFTWNRFFTWIFFITFWLSSLFLLIVETVLKIPTIELNGLKLDDQSTDGTEQIDDGKRLLQNSDKIDAILKIKSENEEEHHLMLHSPVYQNTVESSPKKINHTTSVIGSIRSLNSSGNVFTVKCRTILWYMSFVGFMVNYLFRLNVNIAIVEMVARKTSATSNYHPSECVVTFNQTINSSTVHVHEFEMTIRMNRNIFWQFHFQ